MSSLRRCIPILALILLPSARVWAQEPAPQDNVSAEQLKAQDLAQAQREVAVLPSKRASSIAEIVKFRIEADMLSAHTTLPPMDGEVRLITPDVPGIVRVRALDLPAVDDPSTGRNFTYVHNDLTQPGTRHQMTHLSSIAGRLNLARDAESGEMRSSIQLVQDPPGTPVTPDQPSVRFMVRIWSDSTDQPLVDLKLEAESFTDLRRRYPRELETYLRPILREFRQDQSIFAVDPRVAWQVLGDDFIPDEQTKQNVNAVLENFNSDDFRQREGALEQLRQVGQPAALLLGRADRSNFSAEQNAAVDTFLTEYLQLNEHEAARLRGSAEFLLDTMAVDDATLRGLAAKQLSKVLGKAIDFDPEGSPETRAAQLQKLRDLVNTAPATAPSPK